MAALVSTTILGAGCGGGEGAADAEVHGVRVVGYEALRDTYRRGLEPAFARAALGARPGFENSFGPSSAQTDALAGGEPASIVHLERTIDMERLVKAGVVAADWDEQPYDGIADRSVIVFVLRKGNPERIHNVRDLLRKHVDVVLPDPVRTAAGQWGVMDVYATRIHERKSRAEALAAVRTVLEKTIVRAASPAAAMAAFLRGRGDVLITYESEAIQAVEAGKGKRFQFVVPHQTMLVENPIAVTKEWSGPQAEAFLRFIWSTGGQEILAEHGFRPANRRLVNQERFFPRPALRIQRFGGWAKVSPEFFDPQTGSIARIERQLGRAR